MKRDEVLESDYTSLCQIKNVSRETFLRMKTHQSLLIKWQNAYNLVAKSTLDDCWNRHFLDSAQLLSYLPPKSVILDLGSGAGFPGLVLAICGYNVTIVESDEKKIQFMKNVSRETFCTNVTFIHSRIEKSEPQKFDIITSRALADLSTLFEWSEKFLSPDSICLFHKGENWSKEIDVAKKNWNFSFDAEPSRINKSSCILRINSINRRG